MKMFLGAAALALVTLTGASALQPAEARPCGYWGWVHGYRTFIRTPCGRGPGYYRHNGWREREWRRERWRERHGDRPWRPY